MAFRFWMILKCLILLLTFSILDHAIIDTSKAHAQELDRERAFSYLRPPYDLGDEIDTGVWELINLDSRVAGYGFETQPLAALPGFSGAPINLFVQVTLEGKFINAEIITHNEPIFVSGLGEAAFHNFVTQYRGLSITDTIVVGVPYGGKSKGSSLVYLDGVTKATASVRIAHETILAASFAIAREKMAGIAARQPTRPDPDYSEELTWDMLVEQGIAKRKLITNADVQEAFKDSTWEDDDAEAADYPDDPYLDLWVVDLGPTSIAKAALTQDSFEELERFKEISDNDEPILVIDAGRHGLVGPDFIRNTSPDLIFAKQDKFPIALRDADLDVELANGVPGEVAMILRTDRRLGFDPTKPWQLSVRAIREHGVFRPEIGTRDFTITHVTDGRFFKTDTVKAPPPAWRQAIEQRAPDLIALTIGLIGLYWLMLGRMQWLASLPNYTTIRFTILAIMIGFVGWWGQGQLSIATVLGIIRGVLQGQSLEFLVYDPFSLLIWGVVIVSFVLWGRGLFCGWLCPFGAMQEFASKLGEMIGIAQYRVPETLDYWLRYTKYFVLAGLVYAALFAPALTEKLNEIEPFKTAVTVYFMREWYYVAYAVGLLIFSMFIFKGFCRYVCPLGAVMAIGGMLRISKWIDRRIECGSPCQLCKVACDYNAIKKTGEIRYDECFQCLECITIHDDDEQCVPQVLAARGTKLKPTGLGQPIPQFVRTD